MPTIEMTPGAFDALFAKAASVTQMNTRRGLQETAAAVAHQAQINVSTGSHAYGTPTPAQPGTGPATISETLKRSIAYSLPLPQGIDWVSRIGARSGMYPAYGGRTSKTPSSRYGYYLETALRNGTTYPWLLPAAKIAAVAAPVAFRLAFAGPLI
jgi:hypothetical protein